MRHNKYPLISTLIFIAFSCSSPEANNQNRTSLNKLELNVEGQLNVPIDSITPLSSSSMWHFESKDKSEYFTYAINDHTYKVFEVKTGNEKHTIQINIDGIDAIKNVRGGLFPINENEFLVMEGGIPVIDVIDSNAHIIRKIKYPIDSKFSVVTSAGYTVNGHQPVMIKNDKLYVPDFYFGPWARWEKGYVLSKPLLVEIDTANRHTGFLRFSLPNHYWDEGPELPYFYTCLNEGNFIFSIHQSHLLYVESNNEMRKVNAQSAYLPDFDKYPLNLSPTESFKYQVTNGGYSSILYDRYRNLYYRFVIHPYKPTKSEVNWAILRKYPPRASIIVLNKNLDVIGEVQLPDKKHNIYNSFIGSDGLYISNSHPENPSLKENSLTFTIYTVQNKQQDES